MQAVGFLEVYGAVAGFVAADAACKAANVTIEAFDNNRPKSADVPVPVIIVVKIRGSLEDVKAAVDAGAEAAKKISGVIQTHVIARPEEDTEKLLRINCLKKK